MEQLSIMELTRESTKLILFITVFILTYELFNGIIISLLFGLLTNWLVHKFFNISFTLLIRSFKSAKYNSK
jgi:hypothetical protein